MIRRHPIRSAVAVLLLVAVCGVTWSFLPSPLPVAAPWAGALPPAAPPAEMAIYALPTGAYQAPAALAFRGGSFSDTRELAATPVLVRHPKGDLLIDTGFGEKVEAQIGLLPSFQRAPYHREQTAKAQLEAGGYDLGNLKGIIITHCHWDHVSALPDLGVPVWMNAAEQKYVEQDRDDTRVFRSFSGLQLHSYAFDGPAYLGFPSSHDVWGDGSVVLVPAPGHTPGSIIAFVTLPGEKRYAFIGDLTWQLDGIEKRAERPLMMRAVADHDPAEVRLDIARIGAIAGLFQVVPAHDGRAHASIQPYPRSPAPR